MNPRNEPNLFAFVAYRSSDRRKQVVGVSYFQNSAPDLEPHPPAFYLVLDALGIVASCDAFNSPFNSFKFALASSNVRASRQNCFTVLPSGIVFVILARYLPVFDLRIPLSYFRPSDLLHDLLLRSS